MSEPVRDLRLVLNDEGFNLVGGGLEEPIQSVVWGDVQSIRTYKHDLMTTDAICLAFKVGEDSWVEITEEIEGFNAVREAMHTRFPEIPVTWGMDVSVPAFEPNNTQLYPYDEESYQRQLAERKTARKADQPDWLSIGDCASVICGVVASAQFYKTGHPLLMVAAVTCVVLTITGGIGIRRIYDVHFFPWWFVKSTCAIIHLISRRR